MSYTVPQPPRAVASNFPPPAYPPAAPADEAGGRGQRPLAHARVDHVDPVDGWSLHSYPYMDGEGFWRDEYAARRGDAEVPLDVSRFRFTPSQARFAWLVRNGFPPRPAFGPWDDTDIEARIQQERGQ